jgi:hypothetical protein
MARLIDKEKDAKFIKLYKRGVTYELIAKALKNKSKATVYERYKRLVREKKLIPR